MKLPPFRYLRAESLDEALALWADESALFLAGGQGLLSDMGLGQRRPSTLIDISTIPELRRVTIVDDLVSIGAGVRLAELEAAPPLRDSLIGQACRHIAFPPIRALATVGGNFGHGSPTAELSLAAAATGATLQARRRDGTHVSISCAAWPALRSTTDTSEFLIASLEVPVNAGGGSGFREIGEQRDFVPAVAIAWLRRGTPADENPETVVAIALRDGRRCLVTLRGAAPRCTQADLEAELPANAHASDIPASWLCELVNDELATYRTFGGAST